MWFKFSLILFTAAFVFSHTLVQAQATISSTQFSLQSIVNLLVTHENRLKSIIAAEGVKLDAAISDIGTNSDLSGLSTALKNVKGFLGTVNTVNDYGQRNITLNCGNVAVISASIRFYIQNCYDINYKAVTNATLLMVQYGNLNSAFQLSSNLLSNNQKQKIQAVLTSIILNNDEYAQYEVSLLTSIYQYTTITSDLLHCKNTVCSCPVKLSASANQSLAVVDNTITLVQKCVANWEAQIRNISRVTTALIASFNPGLKKNSDFIQITTTLDTISTFLSGYLTLNTYDAVNATTNCDDAALKIALIQFKLLQYFRTNIEAATNSSFVIVQLGLLNTYFFTKSDTLSDSQKKNVQSVITSINALLEDFRQYSLSMITGWVRLYQLSFQAQTASDESCICKPSGGGSGSTVKPSTAAITSL